MSFHPPSLSVVSFRVDTLLEKGGRYIALDVSSSKEKISSHLAIQGQQQFGIPQQEWPLGSVNILKL